MIKFFFFSKKSLAFPQKIDINFQDFPVDSPQFKTTMRSLIVAVVICAVSFSFGFGQNATTDPVGVVKLSALGNSDSYFGVPLHREAAFQGLVDSVNDNTLTVQGSPGWSANQFVYSAGVQNNTYFVLIASGSKEGMYYTITSNGASTLTVDLAGDNITGAVTNGTKIKIIPYWTLATLFPNQSGITGTTSITGTGSGFTKILIPDLTSSGINLPAVKSYYYYTGSSFGGPGWRLSGAPVSSIKNHDVIPTEAFFIVRQNGVATSEIAVTGAVPVTALSYVVGTVEANVAQDNAIGFGIPAPTTLGESGLYSSGSFAGTTSATGSSGDTLLVFDNAQQAYNKNAIKSYYYYTGSSFGGPGWRQKGTSPSIIRDSETVFTYGTAVIIRKQATATPATSEWRVTPNYLPL